MKNLTISFILLIFLLGCATAESGRTFDTQKAQRIQIGKTTESQVISLLGAPLRTKTKSNGETKFRYAHGKATVAFGSVASKYRVLDITFDRNGVVKEIDRVN